VPPQAGDVERLTVALGMARGVHVAIFAPVRAVASSGPAPDTRRGRAALLAEPPANRVVVGGGAAAAIRGAGLDEMAPLVERAKTETGLLLMAPRAVFETAGSLDPAMDDGADLALLDFTLRARAAGIAVRVLEDTRPVRKSDVDPVAPRRAFMDANRGPR
jgi:hypothetical protein